MTANLYSTSEEFDRRLRAESAMNARYGRPLACIMLKSHDVCDIAHILGEACRIEDAFCRIDDDLYVILCPGVTAAGEAMLANRLQTSIVGSFGVSDGHLNDELLSAAHEMMERAEQDGGDCVRCESGPQGAMLSRAA